MPEEVSKYPKMPEGWNPSDDSDDEYMPAPKNATKKRVIKDDIAGIRPPTKKEKKSADPKVEMKTARVKEETQKSLSPPPAPHLVAKVGEMLIHQFLTLFGTFGTERCFAFKVKPEKDVFERCVLCSRELLGAGGNTNMRWVLALNS